MKWTVLALVTHIVFATPEPPAPDKKVVYKEAQSHQFEDLLIHGRAQRQQAIVVTGSEDKNALGLIKLREGFQDKMAQDLGEGYP